MSPTLNKKIIALSFAGLFLLLAAPACYAYKVEVSLPGMPDSVSDPGAYMRYLFIFGVSLAGFLAVGMIIYGGVKYMLAASVGSTQDAKDKILGALGGVALILCSYLLLYTIDPSLTNLSPNIKPVGNISSPSETPRYGITTTETTITQYFDSTAVNYNTAEKCEAIGKSSYGSRFVSSTFNSQNCIITIKKL
ncbi:MAG TPA: hypothetical protein P5089_00005 [Candidatus Portnoybacteria bacterium]|nr:hypothetical protein [Candidatus Portnoybacteria bacterium]